MLPDNDRGRPPAGTAPKMSNGDKATLPAIADHLAHHERRVLTDALLDAWGPYWERRARALEAARPRPGDFHGNASRAELSAQWRRLTEAAQACRNRARISPLELIEADVDNVLEEAV